jgi:hypothetical protein
VFSRTTDFAVFLVRHGLEARYVFSLGKQRF